VEEVGFLEKGTEIRHGKLKGSALRSFVGLEVKRDGGT